MQNSRKHINLKIATMFLLIVSILIFSVACNNNGLKIGFSRSGRLPSVFCAVKSDKTQFSLDDITLDFYFGGANLSKYEDLDYEPTCVAVYFRNSRYIDGESIQSMNIEDYKAIKDFHFVKEISFEQYNSGEYNVETPRFF